jgi:Zn-dependent protease
LAEGWAFGSWRGASMRDPFTWSLTVGRIAGVTVRLHLLFLLFVGFWLVFTFLEAPTGERASATWRVLCLVAMLFGCVLLHEFGHCAGARKVGGWADEVVLWPLGGLAFVRVPHTPYHQLVATICGPVVNLVLGLMSLAVLLTAGFRPGSYALVIAPVQTLSGQQVSTGWPFWVGAFFTINATLFSFNLLPAFPMDGGRILRDILWWQGTYREATRMAVQVAKITAIAMVVVGIYLGLKGWLTVDRVLLLLAAWVYLNAELENQRVLYSEAASILWSHGEEEISEETPSPKRRPGLIERWKQRLKERSEERARRARQEEERLLDAHPRPGQSDSLRAALPRTGEQALPVSVGAILIWLPLNRPPPTLQNNASRSRICAFWLPPRRAMRLAWEEGPTEELQQGASVENLMFPAPDGAQQVGHDHGA